MGQSGDELSSPTSDSFRREGATSLCSSSEDQTRRDPGKGATFKVRAVLGAAAVRPGPAGTMGTAAGGLLLQPPPLPG